MGSCPHPVCFGNRWEGQSIEPPFISAIRREPYNVQHQRTREWTGTGVKFNRASKKYSPHNDKVNKLCLKFLQIYQK